MPKWFVSLKSRFGKGKSVTGGQTLSAALLAASTRNIPVGQFSPHSTTSNHPTSIPQLRQPKKTTIHSVNKNSDVEEIIHRHYERRYWLFSAVTSSFAMFGAIIAAWAAVGAWNASWRQANIAQDTLNEIQAGAGDTKRAVSAAEVSAVASTRQAEISRDAEVQGLRPYIIFSKTDIPRYTFARFEIHVLRRMVNTGRSAAINIQRDIRFKVLHWPLPNGGADLSYADDAQVAVNEQIGYMTPEQQRTVSSNWSAPDDIEAWASIVRGHAGYVFVEYGTVRYEDVFGGVHHLWLCHFWNGITPTVDDCPKGNRMD